MFEAVAQSLKLALPELLPQGEIRCYLEAHASYLANVQAALRQSASMEAPCNGGLGYGYTLNAAQFRNLALPSPALALSFPIDGQHLKHQPPPAATSYARHIVLCLHRTAASLSDKLRQTRAPHGGLAVIVLRQSRTRQSSWLLEPQHYLLPYLQAQALSVTPAPSIIPFRRRAAPESCDEASPGPLAVHSIGVALQVLGRLTDCSERGFPAPEGRYRA